MSSSYAPISTASSSNPNPNPNPNPSTNLDFISRAKQRVYSSLAPRRPWRQIFDYHALSCPHGVWDAVARLRSNFSYFRMNFAMIILFIIFLSLLWHPISLIVFIVMMVAWLFLYFLRDVPLAVFGRQIDDRIVLVVLGALTIVFLILTGVTLNVVVALAVGLGILGIYSIFRKTDDLYLDEEAAVSGGLVGRGGGADLRRVEIARFLERKRKRRAGLGRKRRSI